MEELRQQFRELNESDLAKARRWFNARGHLYCSLLDAASLAQLDGGAGLRFIGPVLTMWADMIRREVEIAAAEDSGS